MHVMNRMMIKDERHGDVVVGGTRGESVLKIRVGRCGMWGGDVLERVTGRYVGAQRWNECEGMRNWKWERWEEGYVEGYCGGGLGMIFGLSGLECVGVSHHMSEYDKEV